MTHPAVMETLLKLLRRKTSLVYLTLTPFAVYLYDTDLDYTHRLTHLGYEPPEPPRPKPKRNRD